MVMDDVNERADTVHELRKRNKTGFRVDLLQKQTAKNAFFA
jgi:hypothetical protein